MKLGPYEILDAVGRGGMGVVHRARAPDGSVVAVKVLHKRDDDASAARFERERRLLRTVGEGFVPVLDEGESPRGPYLVMPFLTGGTLRTRLDDCAFDAKPMSIDEVVGLARALAAAMARAHALGIVHRDLKPENVLFHEGRPLIADLGLAKHFRFDVPGASQSVALTADGTTSGTIGYMAPEQITGAKDVGPPADVFAIGVILHECLANAPLFESSGTAAIAHVLSGPIPALESVRRDAPDWLASLVDRCLARNVWERPRDGAELLALLEQHEAHRPGGPSARVAATLVALALMAVVATVVVFLRQRASGRSGTSAAAPLTTTAATGVASPSSASPTVRPGLPLRARPLETFGPLRLSRVHGSHQPGHAGPLLAVTFAARDRAVTISKDGAVFTWDLARGELARVAVVPGPLAGASSDGRTAFLASQDGAFTSLDLESGQRSTASSRAGLRAAAFSPDGRSAIATSSGRGPAVLVVPATGEVRCTIETARSQAVALGTTLAALARDDGRVELRSLADGELVQTFRGESGTSSIAIDAEGRRVATGGQDGWVRCWHVASGALLASTATLLGRVTAVAFSPDGKQLLAGGRGGGLELWSLDERPAVALDGRHEQAVTGIAFSADGKGALTGSSDQSVRAWELASLRTTRLLGTPAAQVLSLAFTGAEVVTVDVHGAVRSIDAATGAATTLRVMTEETVGGTWSAWSADEIALAPNGRWVAWSDRELRVAGLRTASEVSVGPPPYGFAFSGDGRRLLAVTRAGSAVAYDLERGMVAAEVPGVRVDGRGIIAGSTSGDRLFVAADPARVVRLDGAVTAVAATGASAAAFAGDRLVVGEPGGPVLLLGDAARRIAKHGGAVTSIATAGDRAVSCGLDRVVRLLDLSNGRELGAISLEALGDCPFAAAFARDGRLAVATGRMVLVYDAR